MEGGSSSNSVENRNTQKGSQTKSRVGSMFQKIEPFVRRTDHNPRELRSWAKRTGFVSTFSGETTTSASENFNRAGFGVERGVEHHNRGGGSSPKIEIDPVLGRTRPARGSEIEPELNDVRRHEQGNNGGGLGRGEKERRRIRDEPGLVDGRLDNGNEVTHVNGNRNEAVLVGGVGNQNQVEHKKEEENKLVSDVHIDMYPGGEVADHGGSVGYPGMRLGLRDNPGYG